VLSCVLKCRKVPYYATGAVKCNLPQLALSDDCISKFATFCVNSSRLHLLYFPVSSPLCLFVLVCADSQRSSSHYVSTVMVSEGG
jgi:hypothetical protein